MSILSSRADALLTFWFADEQASRWFAKSATFDEQIRTRFGAEVQAAAEGRLDVWADTPRGWLALLLMLDQFPRNLYRDDPRAWAQDVSAQRLALSGIAEGFDRQLPPLQRGFAYMPLEHAENEGLQQRSVALFEALYAEVTPAERLRFRSSLNYARRHCEVIARFGRFPHRNAVLDRPSTEEELHYLAQPGAGF